MLSAPHGEVFCATLLRVMSAEFWRRGWDRAGRPRQGCRGDLVRVVEAGGARGEEAEVPVHSCPD